ncbi:UPF0481 protein At3g47200-like [Chenopodium quinoa]|uniref:UPF0481 protein At3g47200-like n=1 Tax=Chenopodium quinoa TaxID=63459 RepID=UPI000B79A711|nr:UPF0481 protein At3g47200-like [Chenopodium quinoa]
MSCCLSLSVSTNKNNQTRSAANSSPSVSYIHKALSFFFLSSLCCIKLLRRNQHHLKRDEAEADGTNLIRRLCYSAKQLKDSGVTFVASSESDNPLDITFANGKLNITKLEIHDNTETYLRNLIYFEKCHHLGSSYFIDYVIFIDALVDTVEDVQVLVKNKILSNHLGSDEDVVNLFNNIGKKVPVSYEVYSDVSDALNRYASTRRNRWIAILRSKYFNHPWVILSVIAAIILFVLTLLQTVASFSNN